MPLLQVELTNGTGNSNEQLWFTIGSVDTFERNLENAQHELQFDSSRYLLNSVELL